LTIYSGLTELVDVALVSILTFTLIVIYTRLAGLRSLAKMTSVDFVTTLAIGSLVASLILPTKFSIASGCFAIFAVYALQLGSSYFRAHSSLYRKASSNSPKILVTDGVVDTKMLKKVKLSEADLISKLREANVLEMSKVRYVVFESTGDVSVLHGDSSVDDYLLSDIR
jgi:uncharacterized membrane protein YcaP (DUF421 family)